MKKTAFVYDKWLSSLGGGEVVACNLATTLRDLGYQTTFIAGQLIDKKIILQKLGIDMSNINFVQAFNDEEKIKQITKDADIFINASFWDYTQSSAKKQLYYTSFPGKASPNSIKARLRSFLISQISHLITPLEKINDEQYIFYQLKPNNVLTIKFSIILKNFSKANLEKIKFYLENIKPINQKIVVDHFHNCINYEYHFQTLSSSVILNKNINLNSPLYTFKINNLLTSTKFSKLNSIIRAGDYPNLYQRIHSFNLIFANSLYTSSWIKKYWNTDAHVLYPPVNLIKYGKSIKRKNYICSVGRFFTVGHGKKQEIMIEAFKKLFDQGLTSWELHLAGGLGTEPTSMAYAEYLKTLSKNYPIYFHFNESRQFIENLYLESKIYWHAAGFGEDPNKDPIKFEHFGITPIEAISAGCIPLLFNGGGLSEVIKRLNLDPELHLFDTVSQLATNTQKLINHNTKLPINIYKQLESLFGLKRFKDQFKKNISNLK